MNPPLGTTPNLVWPTNINPFQTQGGVPPWPSYNNQSLVPQYMTRQGLLENAPWHQPQGELRVQTNCNQNNSGASEGAITCPCCGNVTNNRNAAMNWQGQEGFSIDHPPTGFKRFSTYNKKICLPFGQALIGAQPFW